MKIAKKLSTFCLQKTHFLLRGKGLVTVFFVVLSCSVDHMSKPRGRKEAKKATKRPLTPEERHERDNEALLAQEVGADDDGQGLTLSSSLLLHFSRIFSPPLAEVDDMVPLVSSTPAGRATEPPPLPPPPVPVTKKEEKLLESKKAKVRQAKSHSEPSDAGIVIPIVAQEDYNWFLKGFKHITGTKTKALERINEQGLTEWRTVPFMEKTINGFLDDFEAQNEEETGDPPEIYRAIEKDMRLLCSLRKAKQTESKAKDEQARVKEERDLPGKRLREGAVQHTSGSGSLSEVVKETRAGGAAEPEESTGAGEKKGPKPRSAKKARPADLMFEAEAKKADNEAKRLELEEERLKLEEERLAQIPIEQARINALALRKLEAKEKAEENRHREAMAAAEAQKAHNDLLLKLLISRSDGK
jgi:hypothetical protein